VCVCVCEWYADNGFLIDSEECEEAYSDLLSLYEARKQQNAGAAHSLNYSSCDTNTLMYNHTHTHTQIQCCFSYRTNEHTAV